MECRRVLFRSRMRQELNMTPHCEPPGAQSRPEYQRAIGEAFLKLPQQYPNATCIAVVTHGGPCKAVTTMLADGRLPSLEKVVPVDESYTPNCSVTHITRWQRDGQPFFKIECLNDASHLLEVTRADYG